MLEENFNEKAFISYGGLGVCKSVRVHHRHDIKVKVIDPATDGGVGSIKNFVDQVGRHSAGDPFTGVNVYSRQFYLAMTRYCGPTRGMFVR